MDSDQKISTLQTPPSPTLPIEETPEPIAAPIISRSTPIGEGLGVRTPATAPLPPTSPTPPIVPQPQIKQSTIIPAPAMLSSNIPETPPVQLVDKKINLEEELAPKTLKYSIRTMAQDFERAREEGISPTFSAKTPTMPPPPPLRSATTREPVKAPTPSAIPAAPTITIAGISPSAIPTPSMPSMMPPTRPSIIPPPVKKPSRISFAHLNLIIITVSVIIIFIGSLGFSYWWFFVRVAPIEPIAQQPPIEEELPPPAPKEPAIPEGIISADRDIIVEISEKSPSEKLTSSLISQISESAKKLGDKELARIFIKYSSETEKQYLSFAESAALLDLTIPDKFAENITGGEFLVYNQDGEMRYGLATKLASAVSMIDIMRDWEKTLIDDLKNIYIEKTPTKPEGMAFKDFSYESFISRYLSLSTPDISMTWGVSDAKKIFVIATSKDMMYKIIEYKETERPVLRTFSSGTLVRAKGDTKIYRIIDDKKLWIPTVKAFIDSGYPARSEIEILPEELAQYQDAKYIKLKDAADIYEIKGDKKYLVANPQTVSPTEIKTVTNAESIAYPTGQ